mmetsp:Transcript_5585/g.10194  ORF Transcript_5585/g.10194 Transcript_5585/m.10194 type:complete len:250 (+) Transcript_5585:239-988(+)
MMAAAVTVALANKTIGNEHQRDHNLGQDLDPGPDPRIMTTMIPETDTVVGVTVTKNTRKRAAAVTIAAVVAAAACRARADPENEVADVKKTERSITIAPLKIERNDTITNGTVRRAKTTRRNPADTTVNGREIVVTAAVTNNNITTILHPTLPPPFRTTNAKSSTRAITKAPLLRLSQPAEAVEAVPPTSENTASSTPPTSTPTPKSNPPSNDGSPKSRAYPTSTARSTSSWNTSRSTPRITTPPRCRT